MKIHYQHRKQQQHAFISTNNTYPLHLHKNVEVALVLSGSINITVHEREYALSAGDLIIIFPHQPHSYRTMESSRIMLVFFDAAYPSEYAGDFMHYLPDSPMIPGSRLSGHVPAVLQTLYRLCSEHADSRLLKAYATALAGHILPSLSLKKISGVKDLDSVQKILAYVDNHYLEPITLEHAAKELSISKFFISRIFSEQLHVPFRDYVNQRRTALAHMLLLSTENPVTEIAFDCGFNSLRSFYRAFKKDYGASPNLYRKSIQNGITEADD